MGKVPLESPVGPDIIPGCVGVLNGLLRVPAQASLCPLHVIPVLNMGHDAVDGGGPGHLQFLVTLFEILDVSSPPLLDHVAKAALHQLGQVHEVVTKDLEALGEHVPEEAGPVQPHVALIPLNNFKIFYSQIKIILPLKHALRVFFVQNAVL